MWMHFTTLVKHPKKVFQGLFPHAMGGVWSLPGVAGCWMAVPFLMSSSVGTQVALPYPSDVPAMGSFHRRDPRALP